MLKPLSWDERKRTANMIKHGLDFANARWVLDSPYRLDVETTRSAEARIQSFAYVMNVLAVLTVVHTPRQQSSRVISFRKASREECEVYYEWLQSP